MRNFLIFIFSFQALFLLGQVDTKLCTNPKFEKTIERYISHSVDVIGVDELYETKEKYVLLDARELTEFETSHIPGSVYFGFDNPDLNALNALDKDQPIVMYCSIGYRSEKMAELLEDKGFTNVKNLYGSIFEWGNKSYPLVDSNGEETNKIHTYSKLWSKWVENSRLEKVY